MAIDFPDNPQENDEFTVGTKTWVYRNSRWELVGTGEGASIVVSPTAPSSPAEGDLWFDSSEAATYVYYDSFWVAIGPGIPNQIEEIIAAKGDLIVADTPSTAIRLGVGSNGQVLTANSSTTSGLSWSNPLSTDNLMVVVNHGSDSTVARPSPAGSVYWIGSVAPDNAINGDQWFDTSY